VTNLYPNPSLLTSTAGEASIPGAIPVPGGVMNGNPAAAQFSPNGLAPPGPQNTSSQLLATQISNGDLPLHVQPSTTNAQPGTDSLLAQLARGQLSLGQSNYGQASFAPTGGNSPQAPQNPPVPAVVTGQASVPLPTPVVFAGN
jgi:hypothetical protein